MTVGVLVNDPYIFLSDEPSTNPPSKLEQAAVNRLLGDRKVSKVIKERPFDFWGTFGKIPALGHLFSATKNKEATGKENDLFTFISPNKVTQTPVMSSDKTDMSANEHLYSMKQDDTFSEWENISNSGSQVGSEDSWEKV